MFLIEQRQHERGRGDGGNSLLSQEGAEEDGGRKSGTSTAWKFRIWLRMANLGARTFVSTNLDGFCRRAVAGGTAVPRGRLLWKAARLTGDGSPYPMREELQR
jgi:hypothetical protein